MYTGKQFIMQLSTAACDSGLCETAYIEPYEFVVFSWATECNFVTSQTKHIHLYLCTYDMCEYKSIMDIFFTSIYQIKDK